MCIVMQVDNTDDCAIRSVGSLSHQQRKELKSTVSELYNGTHRSLNELHYMCYLLDDNEIILNSLKGLSSVNLCSWSDTKLTILSAALVNITCVCCFLHQFVCLYCKYMFDFSSRSTSITFIILYVKRTCASTCMSMFLLLDCIYCRESHACSVISWSVLLHSWWHWIMWLAMRWSIPACELLTTVVYYLFISIHRSVPWTTEMMIGFVKRLFVYSLVMAGQKGYV